MLDIHEKICTTCIGADCIIKGIWKCFDGFMMGVANILDYSILAEPAKPPNANIIKKFLGSRLRI